MQVPILRLTSKNIPIIFTWVTNVLRIAQNNSTFRIQQLLNTQLVFGESEGVVQSLHRVHRDHLIPAKSVWPEVTHRTAPIEDTVLYHGYFIHQKLQTCRSSEEPSGTTSSALKVRRGQNLSNTWSRMMQTKSKTWIQVLLTFSSFESAHMFRKICVPLSATLFFYHFPHKDNIWWPPLYP